MLSSTAPSFERARGCSQLPLPALSCPAHYIGISHSLFPISFSTVSSHHIILPPSQTRSRTWHQAIKPAKLSSLRLATLSTITTCFWRHWTRLECGLPSRISGLPCSEMRYSRLSFCTAGTLVVRPKVCPRLTIIQQLHSFMICRPWQQSGLYHWQQLQSSHHRTRFRHRPACHPPPRAHRQDIGQDSCNNDRGNPGSRLPGHNQEHRGRRPRDGSAWA